jgi:hypothetical protein
VTVGVGRWGFDVADTDDALATIVLAWVVTADLNLFRSELQAFHGHRDVDVRIPTMSPGQTEMMPPLVPR